MSGGSSESLLSLGDIGRTPSHPATRTTAQIVDRARTREEPNTSRDLPIQDVILETKLKACTATDCGCSFQHGFRFPAEAAPMPEQGRCRNEPQRSPSYRPSVSRPCRSIRASGNADAFSRSPNSVPTAAVLTCRTSGRRVDYFRMKFLDKDRNGQAQLPAIAQAGAVRLAKVSASFFWLVGAPNVPARLCDRLLRRDHRASVEACWTVGAVSESRKMDTKMRGVNFRFVIVPRRLLQPTTTVVVVVDGVVVV